MQLDINEEQKLVSIWLTNADQKDKTLEDRLKPLYAKFKEQKYLVAVFLSGQEDLRENTRALLQSNRERMARKAVRER